MSNVFSRSWSVAALSFRILGQDKEILLFPLLGGIFSLLFSSTLFFPTLMFLPQQGDGMTLELIIIFVGYLGLAFIATFFNVCTVYTTKSRLEGGNATFMESLGFAFSKLGLILAWSLVSATVGQILYLLDSAAENAGVVGKIILDIVTSILGLIWSVITIFVVPAMVYYDLGPFEAIKVSTRIIKQTWGESLIRYYGLGLLQFLLLLLAIPMGIALVMILGPLGLLPVVLYVIGVVLIFSAASMVFNTILFAYADGKTLPNDVDREILANAFHHRESRA